MTLHGGTRAAGVGAGAHCRGGRARSLVRFWRSFERRVELLVGSPWTVLAIGLSACQDAHYAAKAARHAAKPGLAHTATVRIDAPPDARAAAG